MDTSVNSQPLKLKNKSLMQILHDNLELLLFPVIVETLLIANQKTRIYGIILFILITLLTIILYKIHKYRLYKKIIELTESKEFKYKISLSLLDFHPHPFTFKNYIDVPYLVFCNDFSINKHGVVEISVIYENHSQPDSKVYLDEKYEQDVWIGRYEEIVDLSKNSVLTSKELEAFLNQEENKEKI